MNKVALFDFCETLANFQTADPFVDYVRESKQSKRMIFWERLKKLHDKSRIVGLIEYFFFRNQSLAKRLKCYQLKGLSKLYLEKMAKCYYDEVIRPNLIPKMVDELEKLKDSYKIYLVSGGYDLYLNYFVKEFSLDGCISTKIKFEDGVCTGTFDGKDCMNFNKVKLLDHFFKVKPNHVIAYSDSKSDLPMLRWADEGIVVIKNNRGNWNNHYNFKEIVWES